MLWSELFETPEDDLRVQRLANHWMMLFSQWMEDHNSETPLGDIEELHFWQPMLRDGRRINLLHLSGWRLGLMANDISFAIGWLPNGTSDTRGFLLPTVEENRRHYYVVLMTQDDPRDKTDVIWGLNMSTFLHEVTHYFEYKRGYDRALYQRRLHGKDEPRLVDRGPKAYYNDPLEYNAHFQQTLGSLFTAMASSLAQQEHFGEADQLPWLNSFQSFMAKFIDVADRQNYQVMKYLSQANKHKMLRRLYKLYALIRQQWPNVPEIQDQATAYVEKWRAEDVKYGRAPVTA